jgi:hypothetical protein
VNPINRQPTQQTPIAEESRALFTRLAAVVVALGLGICFAIATTMAASTDSEYGSLGDSRAPLQVGYYNLQISKTGGTADSDWHDTTLLSDGSGNISDNTAADVESPIDLGSDSDTVLAPGQSGPLSTTMYVRNQPASNGLATTLRFSLAQDSAAGASDAALVSALSFSVAITGPGSSSYSHTYTYADLEDTGVLLIGGSTDSPGLLGLTSLAPGDSIEVVLTTSLPDQGSLAANSLVAGKNAHLLAKFSGASTSA